MTFLRVKRGLHRVALESAKEAIVRPQQVGARQERVQFKSPAQAWESASPLGNGRLGAMIYGGTSEERLILYSAENPDCPRVSNQFLTLDRKAIDSLRRSIFEGQGETLEPLASSVDKTPTADEHRHALCEVRVKFPGLQGFGEYLREIDLTTACATTEFAACGYRAIRTVFASAVDDVIVMRAGSLTPGQLLAATISFVPENGAEIAAAGSATLVYRRPLDGAINHHRCILETRVHVVAQGGRTWVESGSVNVTDATSLLVFISMATSASRPNGIQLDPSLRNMAVIAEASRHNYSSLLDRHLGEYIPLYSSMSLNFEDDRPRTGPLFVDELPEQGWRFSDAGFARLFFQYARYLQIACSRPDSGPISSYGLWPKNHVEAQKPLALDGPLQMSYWLASGAGLPHTMTSLMGVTEQLAKSGSRVAETLYGARGWVAHREAYIALDGGAPIDCSASLWPMGSALLIETLWTHWEITRERIWLSRLYPLMRGACEFYLDALVTHPRTGELVMSPSSDVSGSTPSLLSGASLDCQLLRDLFWHTRQAAALCKVDQRLQSSLARAAERLPRHRIGTRGQIVEVTDVRFRERPSQTLRLPAHLYAAFPSDQITTRTTATLAAAVPHSLRTLGNFSTAAGYAWVAALWARAREGEEALRTLTHLSKNCMSNNLLLVRDECELSANFGAAAAILEMLLQSHEGVVELLPALPNAWRSGTIKGVCIRPGLRIAMSWRNCELDSVSLQNLSGEPVRLQYKNSRVNIPATRSSHFKIACYRGALIMETRIRD